MKHRFFPFSFLLAFTAVFSSCNKVAQTMAKLAVKNVMSFDYKDSEEWGSVVTRDLDLPAFHAIDATGAINVILVQDSTSSVQVCGNEKCIDSYTIEVHRGELNVKLKEDCGNINKNTPSITLRVTSPVMNEVDFSGASDFHIQGSMVQSSEMDITVSGAGKVVVDTLFVSDLEMKLSGAADISIAKAVVEEDAEFEINGAGNLTANIFSKFLRIELNGAGKAVLTGECERLVADQNAASDVDFSGLKRNVKR